MTELLERLDALIDRLWLAVVDWIFQPGDMQTKTWKTS